MPVEDSLNADEIVRKVAEELDPFVPDMNYLSAYCCFCNQERPDHDPDCLWLEIEKYARSNIHNPHLPNP